MTRKRTARSNRRLRRVGVPAVLVASGLFGFFTASFLGAQSTSSLSRQVPIQDPAQQDSGSRAQVAAEYGRVPLSFEANAGQVRGEGSGGVKFLSRGRGYTLFLSAQGAVLKLRGSSQKSKVQSRMSQDLVAQRSHSNAAAFPIVFSLPEGLELPQGQTSDPALQVRSRTPSPESRVPVVLRLRLEGANRQAKVVGLDELPGKANYFVGSDPAKWRRNVPTYARVKAEDVYPGIDLVYYGNPSADGQLEYDLVVWPGADPKAIALKIETGSSNFETRNSKLETRKSKLENRNSENASPESRTPHPEVARMDANGDLVIETGGGEVRLRKPVVYQEQSSVDSGQLSVKADSGLRAPDNHQSSIGNRKFLDGHFVLAADDEVRFEVSAYDKTRPLIIDPVLSYSTYLGGTGGETGFGIAVDSSGSAYVAGSTDSTDFPTKGPLQKANAGDADVFITKLSADGSALVYSTYLGGRGLDRSNALAIDSAGNAYVTGFTQSTDFPTSSGAFKKTAGGNGDAFVAKLDATGATLTYSTYLGGSGADFGQGIAVDASGSAYVTGSTQSADFPTAIPAQAAFGGGTDAFVTKLKADGSGLVYSTYLGGGATDLGLAIAVDASGNAYVTGHTSSTDFPATPGALQTAPGGNGDAFITKFNAAGSARVYSTYLGGSGFDRGNAIAVDTAGAAFVTGITNSTNFPTASAFQGNAGGNGDAFVAKLSVDGSALAYSTYLGGVDVDEGLGIAVDGSGNAFVTGDTQSNDFPVMNAVQAAFGGGICASASCPDAFVTELNSSGTAPIYSTYLGGSGADFGQAIALNSSGDAFVTGSTTSANFPVIVGAFQQTPGGGALAGDAFVSKITPADAPGLSLSPLRLNFPDSPSGTSSNPKTVTLTNYGTGALPIADISTTGDFSQTNTCGSSVAGNGTSCTISVTFAPTAVADATGTLVISDGAAGSPHTIPLAGKGTAPVPVVTLTPDKLDFADQALNTTSAPQTVLLANTGSAALTITSIATGAANFAQTNDCPGTVNPGASCTVTVTFKPTATGALADAVSVIDNAGGSPQRVNLTGKGIAEFSVTSAPSAMTLNHDAASPTFNVSASAPSNFTGAIQLTCSVSSPATCSFNPTSINPGGTSTMTLSGFAQSASDSFNVVITGTSGAQTNTTAVAITLTNFSPGLSPPLATITAGQSATYTVSIAPLNGFQQGVTLTCGFFVFPGDSAACFLRSLQQTKCSVEPGTVTPDGTNNSTATITITTTSGAQAVPPPPAKFPQIPIIVLAGLLMTAGIAVAARRKLPGYALPLAAMLLLLVLTSSCDTTFTPLFQGTVPGQGTPGGLFRVGIVGKVGTSLTHCASANLGVNKP